MSKESKKNKFLELYIDATSKKKEEDDKVERRTELYDGTDKVHDSQHPTQYSKKKAQTYKNIVYELIETQINNGVPLPKITPRDSKNINLSNDLEGYLKMEMDRLNSEILNDAAERDVLKNGSTFYLVEWNNLKSTAITEGELEVKHYAFDKVHPQPGISDFKDAEYVFVEDVVSVAKIKKLYNVDASVTDGFLNMTTLITCYYYNEKGVVSKYGWIKNTNITVFDEDCYNMRKFRKCKRCGEKVPQDDICPFCQNTKFELVSEENEILPEDIITLDEKTGDQRVLAKEGSTIPYYQIRRLPFVLRNNVNRVDNLYGISDVDKLAVNQESLNKLYTKMEENILKGGSIITLPKGCTVSKEAEVLKYVYINDIHQKNLIDVKSITGNTQADDILADRMYQSGRAAIGITDSYQGKRDPTAESGKAKELSASKAAGRMESKRRMKDAAYADLYELMFQFLLAFCDETRNYNKETPDGKNKEAYFSRYNFLDGVPGAIYYNDRYIFSVDNAASLSNNREAMWQEITRNMQSGAYGNPTEYITLILYWSMLDKFGYPFAKEILKSLKERSKMLPESIQKAIMANPELMGVIQETLTNKEGGGSTNVQNNKQ